MFSIHLYTVNEPKFAVAETLSPVTIIEMQNVFNKLNAEIEPNLQIPVSWNVTPETEFKITYCECFKHIQNL